MGSVCLTGELVKIREKLREQNKKVVFTNGVFDLIHRGHIEYLAKAKAFGDVLMVGINTDGSVRRIKGNKRPLINESDRAFIVASLSSVDYACLFDEDTPSELIRAIVPDILVKGADWDVGSIVGKDVVEKAGGRVMTVDFTPGRSTTSIIERIIDRYSAG